MSDSSNQARKEQPNPSVFVETNFSDYKNKPTQGPKPVLASVNRVQAPIAQTFEIGMEKALLVYFKDLIGLDAILERLTKNLTVFLHRTEEHCSFNYWTGQTLTGKTTLAKRLTGHEGFQPFNIKGIKTFYYDCFTVKDNFETLKKDWADKAKFTNNSIIFIDDVEKCLDDNHKLVDQVFAQKFRKCLEDLSRTRKLFFVFISKEPATRESVQKLFDTKLTSITDYSFKFPEWSTENLLNIILETINARGYSIEPTAAAELAVHCNQHGMVLELQGILQLLDVELRRSGDLRISESRIQKIIKARG